MLRADNYWHRKKGEGGGRWLIFKILNLPMAFGLGAEFPHLYMGMKVTASFPGLAMRL